MRVTSNVLIHAPAAASFAIRVCLCSQFGWESSCEHTSLVNQTAAAACINTYQMAPEETQCYKLLEAFCWREKPWDCRRDDEVLFLPCDVSAIAEMQDGWHHLVYAY